MTARRTYVALNMLRWHDLEILAKLAENLADAGVFLEAPLAELVRLGVTPEEGERLADSSDLQVALETYRNEPALRDLAPITQVIAAPNILVVHPSLPARSVKELIALARKRPGEINYASAGLGTNPHLCMELFLSMAGIKMTHVAYKGLGPAMIDLLAGHVVVATATMLTGLPHVKSGRLRGLGVTGAARSDVLPELPTVAEAGVPGYEAVQWYGLLAPAHTPRDIIMRLHATMASALRRTAGRGGLIASPWRRIPASPWPSRADPS